ncbi:hypothetical protein [Candidatus Nitrotoga arctica]|uniref:Uncharacterized protein n=1 Tax=Candidatus Nitrotoga arctica TaxID=453162 RepID=A0ABM8Z2N5_9PROT|nr:hypothetical protein [Candidatus Nitrotoga arctica]CAG9934093.1 protein of unknown function [Candidatus Nitrotoga arctica]
MAQINLNNFYWGRMGRIEGYFHKLPLETIARKTLQNTCLSAPSAPIDGEPA